MRAATPSHEGRPSDLGGLAIVVLAVLLIGSLAASVWSVREHAGGRGDVVGSAAGDDGWTSRGWRVDEDRPWEASLVRITNRRCRDEIRGSGVVVGGRVWTNRHVVDGAAEVVLTFHDGRTVTVDRLATSVDVDIAVLDSDELDIDGLRWSDVEGGISGGELAGFPGGHDLLVRSARVVATQRGWGDRDPERPLLLDAAVVPGESGSPLIDRSGAVAALVYARSADGGRGLAIPATEVRGPGPAMLPVPVATC